jgi:hypothetical protein
VWWFVIGYRCLERVVLGVRLSGSDRAYAVSRDCDTKRRVVEYRRYRDGEIELISHSSEKKRRFRSS